MNLAFATRDMIRALRVLAPALSRGNQDRIYAAQIMARDSARSAIPATIGAPARSGSPAIRCAGCPGVLSGRSSGCGG